MRWLLYNSNRTRLACCQILHVRRGDFPFLDVLSSVALQLNHEVLSLTATPAVFYGVELSKDHTGVTATISESNYTVSVFFDGNNAQIHMRGEDKWNYTKLNVCTIFPSPFTNTTVMLMMELCQSVIIWMASKSADLKEPIWILLLNRMQQQDARCADYHPRSRCLKLMYCFEKVSAILRVHILSCLWLGPTRPSVIGLCGNSGETLSDVTVSEYSVPG